MKLIAALLAIAAPTPIQPPAPIATHIVDGELDTRDLGWLRGALLDADARQKAEWAAIEPWLTNCPKAQDERVRTELRALGVTPTALSDGIAIDTICVAASNLRARAKEFKDWTSFTAAYGDARNRLDTLLYGAKLASDSMPFDPAWVGGNTTTMKLLRTTVREQVLRKANSWQSTGNGPPIPADSWRMLSSLISIAVMREDRKNTEMLKELVTASGWPSISKVGARASNAAWLLAQHADHDPAFQLQALRLMEPLVATGDVSKDNYAYLYDRIMLKLVGTQRYGTQMLCEGGKRVFRPLDGSGDLDTLRKTVGLNPSADYRQDFDKIFGPCPK